MEHWFIVLLLIAVYLLPTIIAFRRGLKARWVIMFINVFMGWTIAGLFISLIWALAGGKPAQAVVVNNYVGR